MKIAVIDDDISVRESLPELLRALGHECTAFASAEAFLVSSILGTTDCLILDVAMPGMSGPQLRRQLQQQKRDIPTIFVTGDADTQRRVDLLAQGAVECLFKPLREAELRAALDLVVRHGSATRGC
jgi:FixJ family two-component response regulator